MLRQKNFKHHQYKAIPIMGTMYAFIHLVNFLSLCKCTHLCLCVYVGLSVIHGAKPEVTLTPGGVWQCLDAFFAPDKLSVRFIWHNHYGYGSLKGSGKCHNVFSNQNKI